jgi:hypothetical protein
MLPETQKPKMLVRLLPLFIVILTLFFLSGCSGTETETELEPELETVLTPPPPPPPPALPVFTDGHLGPGTLSFTNVPYEVVDTTWSRVTIDVNSYHEWTPGTQPPRVRKSTWVSDGKFSINITGPATTAGTDMAGQWSTGSSSPGMVWNLAFLKILYFSDWVADTDGDGVAEGIVLPSLATINCAVLTVLVCPATGGDDSLYLYMKGKNVRDSNGFLTEKHWIDYWYVDTDVTITASGNARATAFSLTLNKGWNAVHKWWIKDEDKHYAKVEDTADFAWVYANEFEHYY